MGAASSRPDWHASWYAEAVSASERAAEDLMRQYSPAEAVMQRAPRVRALVMRLMAFHARQAADVYAAALRRAERSPEHDALMRLADDAIQLTTDAVMVGSVHAMVQAWLRACARAEAEGAAWEHARPVFLVLCELSQNLADAIAGSPFLHPQLPRGGAAPARVGQSSSDAFVNLCRYMDRMQGAHCGNVRSEEAKLAKHAREALERADAAWQDFEIRLSATAEPLVHRPGHARVREEARQLRTAPYARP